MKKILLMILLLIGVVSFGQNASYTFNYCTSYVEDELYEEYQCKGTSTIENGKNLITILQSSSQGVHIDITLSIANTRSVIKNDEEIGLVIYTKDINDFTRDIIIYLDYIDDSFHLREPETKRAWVFRNKQ